MQLRGPCSSSPKRTQTRSRRQNKFRIARIELVTGTTRTGRTSDTGLPRSQSRSPLRARAVASVQRSPRRESEEQLQKSFSSAGASHTELELLLWMVSRRDATGCIDAIGEVSDVSWAQPQAHGGLYRLTGKNAENRPTFKNIATYFCFRNPYLCTRVCTIFAVWGLVP